MAYRQSIDKKIEQLQPPQSLDAEQAILGSILKDSEALSRSIEIIPDQSFFYYPKHRLIYQVMLDLYEKSEPCDITTVANALLNRGELEKIGGRVYLVDLAESVATTANIASYASIVLEKALLCRLINTSNEIVSSCYQQERPVEELLDAAESHIFKISEYRHRKGFTSLSNLIGPLIEQIEEYGRSGGGIGLNSGFDGLDVMTNGFQRGDFIIVAGRPSMGKTAFALNVAENISKKDSGKNIGVGIFSIEMSQEALALRLLSSRARINQQKIRSGKLSGEEWQRLAMFGTGLSEAKIFIDDSPSLTPLEIRAKARRLKSQHDIGLIIVDYIQMMHAHGRSENRQQEIALISRNLKSLGGEKRPQLSDLRESGAIEQDADVVIFLYRPEFYLSKEERMEDKNGIDSA